MSGYIRIHHQDGLLEYSVTSAKYGFVDDRLFLEIEGSVASEHPFAEHAPDCKVELDQLAVGCTKITGCLGREFVIPTSQVEEPPYRLTNIYLTDHQDVDENHLRFFKDQKATMIEWRGVAPDINYYDHRAKPNAVEIRCQIQPGLFAQ